MGCGAATNTAANNWYHSFYYDDLVPESTWAMDKAREIIDTTAITTAIDQSTSADVRVMDAAYANYCDVDWWSPQSSGVVGLKECLVVNSGGQCTHHAMRLNRLYMENAGTYSGCKNSLATHESLHTLGLNHLDDEDDVMYPVVEGRCIEWISTHNQNHLEAYYG